MQLESVLRVAAGIASPGGRRARLSILIYHRVLKEPDPLLRGEIDAEAFDRHMGVLRRNFNVLSLEDAYKRLVAKELPPRAACVTFDDGYRDNFDVALPILQRWGLDATFFIATGFVPDGLMWNDKVRELVRSVPDKLDLTELGLGVRQLDDVDERVKEIQKIISALKYAPPDERDDRVNALVATNGAALPDNLMMDESRIRGLAEAGMGLGAHTMYHPILAQLDQEEAWREIEGSKRALEQISGRRIGMFAYPNGKRHTDYTDEHVRMVKELGFDAAVSTNWGVAGPKSDIFQLPRFTPWQRDPFRFHLALLGNYRRGDRSP